MADLYRIPAKPAVYKGIPMKSMLEIKTAQALERIGIQFEYEPTRYADSDGHYTPDFRIDSIAIEGWPGYQLGEIFVEARPTMEEPGFRRKAEWNAATLALSTDSPLLFVGLKEFPTALLGWCFGIEDKPVLGAIGQRRKVSIDGYDAFPEPCLYVATAAEIWIDGFLTGQASANPDGP